MLKRSLVALTALAVVVALLAIASPANAAAPTRTSTQPPDVRRVAGAPAWVRTPRVSLDWKWLRAGWEVRFTKRETAYIANGAGACSGFLGSFRHPALRVLALACALLSWYATNLVIRSRCLKAFVRLNLTGPASVGSRAC